MPGSNFFTSWDFTALAELSIVSGRVTGSIPDSISQLTNPSNQPQLPHRSYPWLHLPSRQSQNSRSQLQPARQTCSVVDRAVQSRPLPQSSSSFWNATIPLLSPLETSMTAIERKEQQQQNQILKQQRGGEADKPIQSFLGSDLMIR
ncbi:hypothetical protein LINPERPRIM_LOCUS5199 [Linum perenne]